MWTQCVLTGACSQLDAVHILAVIAVFFPWCWGAGAAVHLAWIFRHQGASGTRAHMRIMSPLLLLVLLPGGDATRLLLVRHGRTFMNEHLSQPGKAWGDPGFVDPGLWDTRLTPTGMPGTYV